MAFINTAKLPLKEPREGWKGRFFHSKKMTFAYYDVKAGATIHEHSHSNDEVWNVIEGRIRIKVAGKSKTLGPGSAAVVPPHAKHSVKALTDARAIVADYPRRTSIGNVKL